MELCFHNLTKKYKDTVAVNEVEYGLTCGIYGLLGVNGAGKTTLIRMICTLVQPTYGSITLDGKDIFGMNGAYRRILGYLPQDFGYYPDLTVTDYMMYIASIKGLRPAYAKQRIKTLLEQVDMIKDAKKKMRKLSGGMIRRVGIAQAMLNNPKILILDEPTAGLDPNERIRFRNLISELANDRLVLLSTHIVSDIEFVANEIILMNQGRFFLCGTPEEIVSSVNTSVWTCNVSRESVDEYLKHYLVANVKSGKRGMELRILCDHPPVPDAYQEEPALEDAFLFHFGETSEESS